MPATMTSAPVPRQTPASAAPAMSPSMTWRTRRLRGQRAMPCQSRRQQGRRPVGGPRRHHGRVRASCCASWRCRTITVRTSCTVAAKRSWPTRRARRCAASSDVPPTTREPDRGHEECEDHPDGPGDLAARARQRHEREVTELPRRRRRRPGHEVEARPRREQQADRRRRSHAEADSRRDERRAPQGERHQHADHRADPDPCRALARQPQGREVARDGAEHRAGEHHAAQLAQRRVAQHESAADGREQHVADVGGVERERSTAAHPSASRA